MCTPASGQASSSSGILVVRLGSMGDVIHALPTAATLKHSFPAARLSWVIDPKWAYLLAGNPFVDRIVLLNRHSLASVRSAWRDLRGERYRLAVDLQGLFKSALVASAAWPDRIYGFHQSQAREPLAALFYSNRVRATSAHIVDRNLELASAAGAASILYSFPLPEGAPEGGLPDGDFVLTCPVAGWPGKQWPVQHYALLARMLSERLKLPLVVNGPPQAASLLSTIEGATIHLSGMPGLVHATRRALAVVGTDSGPLHLAAALEKPGVAIFGPTDPARNGPYGKTFTVMRDPRAVTSYKRRQEISPSMSRILPEAVFDVLDRHIRSRSQSAHGSA